MGGLRTIVDQKGGVLTSLTKVECAKIETGFLSTTLLKHDGKMLLNTSGGDLDCSWLLLVLHIDMNQPGDDVGLIGCQRDANSLDLVWLDREVTRFDLQSFSLQLIDLELNRAGNASLILELDLLMSGGLVRDKPKVDKRLKLDIGGGL